MADTPRLLPLTSVRFFAAVAIVFHHYFAFSFPAAARDPWLAPLIDYSRTAVLFFFALSGYVLGHAYLRAGAAVSPRRFYLSRFARIYPLYIVTIAASVPGLYLARLPRLGLTRAIVGTAATFLDHALLLQHWLPQLGALNYPSWSISSEAFFYLVFPWLGAYVWRRSTLGAAALGAVVLTVTWSVAAVGVFRPAWAILPHIMPLFDLHLFVAGIALARVHEGWKHSQSAGPRLVRWSGWLALVSLAALAGLAEWSARAGWSVFHDGLAGLLFLTILLGFAGGNPTLERLLSGRRLVLLGESSFGLYLLQAPLYELAMALGFRPSPGLFAGYLLVAVGLSVLSFRYFEGPARLAILRHFSARSQESTVEAALAQ